MASDDENDDGKTKEEEIKPEFVSTVLDRLYRLAYDAFFFEDIPKEIGERYQKILTDLSTNNGDDKNNNNSKIISNLQSKFAKISAITHLLVAIQELLISPGLDTRIYGKYDPTFARNKTLKAKQVAFVDLCEKDNIDGALLAILEYKVHKGRDGKTGKYEACNAQDLCNYTRSKSEGWDSYNDAAIHFVIKNVDSQKMRWDYSNEISKKNNEHEKKLAEERKKRKAPIRKKRKEEKERLEALNKDKNKDKEKEKEKEAKPSWLQEQEDRSDSEKRFQSWEEKKKREKYKEDKNYKKLITVSRYERELLLFEILLREHTSTKLVKSASGWSSRGSKNQTVFDLTLDKSDNRLTALLFNYGCDVDVNQHCASSHSSMRTDATYSWKPIHKAIDRRNYVLCEIIIEKGANINEYRTERMNNEYGSAQNEQKTALYSIVTRSNDDNKMLKLLLKTHKQKYNGAPNVNLLNKYLINYTKPKEVLKKERKERKKQIKLWQRQEQGGGDAAADDDEDDEDDDEEEEEDRWHDPRSGNYVNPYVHLTCIEALIHRAVEQCDIEIVKLLLIYGCDIELKRIKVERNRMYNIDTSERRWYGRGSGDSGNYGKSIRNTYDAFMEYVAQEKARQEKEKEEEEKNKDKDKDDDINNQAEKPKVDDSGKDKDEDKDKNKENEKDKEQEKEEKEKRPPLVLKEYEKIESVFDIVKESKRNETAKTQIEKILTSGTRWFPEYIDYYPNNMADSIKNIMDCLENRLDNMTVPVVIINIIINYFYDIVEEDAAYQVKQADKENFPLTDKHGRAMMT